MSGIIQSFSIAATGMLFAAAVPGVANPVLGPTAPASLSLFSLGNVPGVGTQTYEGIAISGNNLLLAVGNANSSIQNIFALPLIRTNNHITSFGNSSFYAGVASEDPGAVGNIISGGLLALTGGVLFTTQGFSYLGQGPVPAGGTSLLDLATPTGAVTGGLQYVPPGFAGAGQLKLSSIFGDWYTVNLSGSFGSYALNSVTPYVRYTVGVGAYAFDYLPADSTFTQPSVIVGDTSSSGLTVYALDGNGNPCPGCATPMHVVTGSGGIGYGVVRDPVTGDVLFTTQNNDIWLLSDSLDAAPEPGTLALTIGGVALAVLLHRKRHAA